MLRSLLVLLMISPFTAFADSTSTNACQSLEAQLKADPESVDLHKKLIDCYFHAEVQSFQSPSHGAEFVKLRVEQVRWMVQHAPTEKFACTVPAKIDSHRYADDYAAMKKEWTDQVQAHPEDAHVLIDAACFMDPLKDRAKAEELAAKTRSLDPHNIEAAIILAQLFRLDRISAKSDRVSQLANQSLQLVEQVMDDMSPEEKLMQMQYAAKDAFDAGNDAKARKYADLILQPAPQGLDFVRGDAIHQGNLILGRLALRNGNLEEAKARLLAAGDTPGSPALGSFGPDMSLAKDLLEKQQTEVVLQYFDECEKFWTHKATLDEWRATVRKGGIPNFGSNLN